MTQPSLDTTTSSKPHPHLERDEAEHAVSVSEYPIDQLVEGARQLSDGRLHVSGLKGALGAAVLTQLQQKSGQPLIIIGPSAKGLEALAEDLAFFHSPNETVSLTVPPIDVSPYSGLSPNRILVAQRLAAIFELTIGELPPFVLVPTVSLARRTPPVAMIEALSDVVAPGSDLDLGHFKRQLVDCGYTPVQMVEDPGTFAIRGGLVDVYSPTLDYPVRIELWGDEVESIRTFEPATQKSIGKVDGVYICPVRDEVFNEESLSRARDALRELADQEAFPSRALRKVMADLEHGLHFLGIEGLLPAFYDELGSVLEVLPEDAITVVFEPDACVSKLESIRDAVDAQRQRRKEGGDLTFPPDELYITPDELNHWLAERPHLAANSLLTPTDVEPVEFRALENHDIERVRAEHGAGEGAIKGLVERLESWRGVYGEIAFSARTTGAAERLASLLQSRDQEVEIVTEQGFDLGAHRSPPAGTLRIYRAGMSAGARMPSLGFALVCFEELFGRRARRKSTRRTQAATFIQSFRELKPGDFLVHVEHGIGRYDGLVKLEIDGRTGDFLLVQYAGADRLYIPVHRLASVQKYTGQEPNRVDKLGGSAWERTKERVKEGIRKMAVDLLKLYAEREGAKGYSFSPPDEYYKEFEASFPFDETVDQDAAIQEVIDDMTRKRPMDRLVCGDVGFGKTEVAIRAAFKAICDGKQVAVLVPTTILAEQHLNSFRTRFASYPVNIEALSRFRTSAETRKIKQDLANGRVDVAVGTHRLLQKSVDFKNLGLLIVDEEHRFGVAHKEKIKEMSIGIDVLTMTATPIPRTLQMSLFGMRDLSLITTPPEDRLAVRTHLARFDNEVIREAVMHELRRGGQIYFLHNRVKTIDQMAARIQKLVPEARVAVGHGQMDERSLEKVMLQFIKGEVNVLVCTTIIESGLDIPNANTLIVNRADRFGLAQLYQLRGRVGRSSQRAHCYLLIPGEDTITGDARERLEAIQRFSDLGSGFEIAQFDLELRGAGNLLGPEQSGHVAAVGLDLYAELLDETLAELKGEYYEESFEPEVNLPFEAYLPDDYIIDVQLRLLFYKRLSSASDVDELYEIYGELADRFGDPPEPVKNLREVIEVKVLTRVLRARGVDANHTAIILNIGDQSLLDPSQVVALVTSDTRKYHLREDMRLVRYLTKKESEDLLGTTKKLLSRMAEECLLIRH